MQNLEHWNLQATEIGSNHHSLQGLSVQGIVHVDFSFLNVFYAIKDVVNTFTSSVLLGDVS